MASSIGSKTLVVARETCNTSGLRKKSYMPLDIGVTLRRR
jgi:hypothetical protein